MDPNGEKIIFPFGLTNDEREFDNFDHDDIVRRCKEVYRVLEENTTNLHQPFTSTLFTGKATYFDEIPENGNITSQHQDIDFNMVLEVAPGPVPQKHRLADALTFTLEILQRHSTQLTIQSSSFNKMEHLSSIKYQFTDGTRVCLRLIPS